VIVPMDFSFPKVSFDDPEPPVITQRAGIEHRSASHRESRDHSQDSYISVIVDDDPDEERRSNSGNVLGGSGAKRHAANAAVVPIDSHDMNGNSGWGSWMSSVSKSVSSFPSFFGSGSDPNSSTANATVPFMDYSQAVHDPNAPSEPLPSMTWQQMFSSKETFVQGSKQLAVATKDRVYSFWSNCQPWKPFFWPTEFSIPAPLEGLGRLRHNGVYYWGNYSLISLLFMAMTIYKNPLMFFVFAALALFISNRIGIALRGQDTVIGRRITFGAIFVFVIMLATGIANMVIGALTTAVLFCAVHAVFHVQMFDSVEAGGGYEMENRAGASASSSNGGFGLPDFSSFSLPQLSLPSLTSSNV